MRVLGKPHDKRPFVVIAEEDRARVLYMIARAATKVIQAHEYELDIQYGDKFEPVVASTLYVLQHVFGWQEVERGTRMGTNTRCVHKHEGVCTHLENVRKQDLENRPPLVCTEEVRKNCPLYVCKSPEGIPVNFIRIEQAGAIRDM